jgi:molybdopterin converting factor small subunit
MPGLITVRYFAGARAATGIDQEELSVSRPWPLEELAEHLAQRHGPALLRVLAAASFLVDETAGTRDRLVQAGSVVDVLPPFAGG